MSLRSAASAVALLASLAAASVAVGMSSSPVTRRPRPTRPAGCVRDEPVGHGAPTTRQEAEQSYSLSYEEVGKANKDLEAGKAKNAEKHFRRALEHGEKAVSLDERYHEAWNLVGFASRKLGDYDRAFRAYDRCLAISRIMPRRANTSARPGSTRVMPRRRASNWSGSSG